MNQNVFPTPSNVVDIPNQSSAPPITNMYPNYLNQNQNDPRYAENILEKNIGRRASFYMSYSDSLEWRDRVFTGTIQSAGRDYAVVRLDEGNRFMLLWTVYLNYVEFFDQPILN